MHKGGKEKMGEMVIRISFFLLPSCGLSHLPTSYLPLFATNLQKTKRRQVQLIGSCISPPFEGSGAGLQKQGNGWGGGVFDLSETHYCCQDQIHT